MAVKFLVVISSLVLVGEGWTQQELGFRISDFGLKKTGFSTPQSEIRSPKLASVWDGVYTEEQAARGQALYNQACASCHMTTLTGGEMATPLVGAEFAASWDGLTVGELFERIRVTMPPDKPERVGRQQKADILAYMLSVNKFPAGKTELPREAHLLNQIRLEMTKP